MTGTNEYNVGSVVLTALELEYQAVRAHLTDLRTRHHPSGTLFEIGLVRGTSTRIAIAVTGEGNRAAAVLVERAVALFRPSFLLFVGIAGALHKDISLGDVVVATRVYGYHGGKEEAAEFLARPRAWETSHDLQQRARHLARTTWWIRPFPRDADVPSFAVHFRPIAAGEVLLDTRIGPLVELIRRHYNDAAAIEMESAGAADAAHLNGALPFLAVRGVSDRADGEKRANDAAGFQSLAAANAALFALAIVDDIPKQYDTQPPPTGGGIDVHIGGDVSGQVIAGHGNVVWTQPPVNPF